MTTRRPRRRRRAATAADDEDVGTCEEVAEPEPKEVKLKPPKEQVQPGEKITATVKTNCGEFEIELDTESSPRTAASFVYLVEEGVYDDTTFHRVVTGLRDPGRGPGAATARGGPGYSITEPPPPDTAYTRGHRGDGEDRGGAARHAPAASSSSSPRADAGLPADYAVLGEVTGGEDTIDTIERRPIRRWGRRAASRISPVVIESITLS